MTSGNQQLLNCENHWITKLGKFFPGERVVFRGNDLFAELYDLSWVGLLLFGITGRRFSENQVRLFEGLWTQSISYPDPRIWNNRVAALAGTARSTATLGTSAAIAITEADIYGHRTNMRAIDFFYRLKASLESGQTVKDVVNKEMKKYRGICGYGRPLVSSDERIRPVMKLAGDLGFDQGDFVKLAFETEKVLKDQRWRMKMNIGALAAALCADQGLSAKEYTAFSITAYTAGITPCYIDSAAHVEGGFFPLRVSSLEYEGIAPRAWD